MIDQVRLIVLGSGTSSGVPVIGCTCDTCRSQDPRDQRLRTAAAVCWIDPDGHDRVVLIDASPDLRQQVLRYGIQRCDAILFTHNHVDHTFGLDEVRRFNVMQQSAIDIWAEPHTLDHLERVYRHIFHKQDNVNDSFIATLTPHHLEPGEPILLYGLRFEPIRLLHGNLPIVGFRLDVMEGSDGATHASQAPSPLPLAWCTDVSCIPQASEPRLQGLQTLFLDMLREQPHQTHMNCAQAIEAAQRLGAQQTWFVHMAHQIRHAAVDATLPQGMALAWDGLTVPLSQTDCSGAD